MLYFHVTSFAEVLPDYRSPNSASQHQSQNTRRDIMSQNKTTEKEMNCTATDSRLKGDLQVVSGLSADRLEYIHRNLSNEIGILEITLYYGEDYEGTGVLTRERVQMHVCVVNLPDETDPCFELVGRLPEDQNRPDHWILKHHPWVNVQYRPEDDVAMLRFTSPLGHEEEAMRSLYKRSDELWSSGQPLRSHITHGLSRDGFWAACLQGDVTTFFATPPQPRENEKPVPNPDLSPPPMVFIEVSDIEKVSTRKVVFKGRLRYHNEHLFRSEAVTGEYCFATEKGHLDFAP